MPTIETRAAPDGTTTYRAKVRIKGAPQVSASFASKTDARKWAQRHGIRDPRRPLLQDRGSQAPHARATRSIATHAKCSRANRVPPNSRRVSSLGGGRSSAISSWPTSPPAPSPRHAPGCSLSRDAQKRARGPRRPTATWQSLSHVLSVAVREWEWLETNAAQKLSKFKDRGGAIASSPKTSAGVCSPRATSRPTPTCTTSCSRHVDGHAAQRDPLAALSADRSRERGMIYLYDTKNGEPRGVPLAGPAHEAMRERARAEAERRRPHFRRQDGRDTL